MEGSRTKDENSRYPLSEEGASNREDAKVSAKGKSGKVAHREYGAIKESVLKVFKRTEVVAFCGVLKTRSRGDVFRVIMALK